MKWSIPAKTFLLGEYASVREESALIATTSPYFDIVLQEDKTLAEPPHSSVEAITQFASPRQTIHPDSPAGLWWIYQKSSQTLDWHDPYHSCGGLGASSAQFIGSYLASCSLINSSPTLKDMLEAYYQCAWNGQGLRPSGYDVIAQTLYGCVYINKKERKIKTYSWPFSDLSFLLVHTGKKLATHHHLQEAGLPKDVRHLSAIVDTAMESFEYNKGHLFIECINEYHCQLAELNLVAEHSLELINQLSHYPEVLAIKGCGALGADIVLIITSRMNRDILSNKVQLLNKKILATECNLALENKNLNILMTSF